MEHMCNDDTRKLKYSEKKILHSATLSTTNPTRTGIESKAGIRTENLS